MRFYCMKQKTINKEVIINGIGVHLGQLSKVILHPAPVDHGIVFFNPKFPTEKIKLGKIVPEQAIHASVLKKKDLIISTIEHLMSVILAFKIDNLLIEINGIEVPILDGSALTFVDLIEKAGIKGQNKDKKFLTVSSNLIFRDEKSGRYLELIPAKINPETSEYDNNFYFDYTADFKHPLVGQSFFKGKLSTSFFKEEIAPARTFGFLEQLPFLRDKGLAKGTSLGNTVVIGEEEFLNQPRFKNEFVRHKLLDLIGDLALLGKNLAGTVIAKKTGHNFNRLITKNYIDSPEKWKLIK
ncbi:UDP-3-O-[3-hydroxymyristoyl] N-acetylglucosamine deacetylase [Candidatus Dependentiae bacterium]|nr:UDP-3-O-[3-hydroxymyristoyl] N-acetylglucosamine deacetylase [Candidatus Dependentiae bacterium]